MKRWIVCDLDGSLMPPSDGLFVSKAVQEKLIALQEKGNTVILNSARVFQGVGKGLAALLEGRFDDLEEALFVD